MFASPAIAVFSACLPRTLRFLAGANVTVVSIREPAPRAQTELDRHLDRIKRDVTDEVQHRVSANKLKSGPESCRREGEAAVKWIHELTTGDRDESCCCIHAEAGAMALVCDARSCQSDVGEHGEYGTAVSIPRR